MHKIKVAVIGCGRVFPKHVESILAFKDQIELVGLCDSDPKALDHALNLIQAPLFNDYQTMLKKAKPDLVSILTPSGLHSEHAIQAANAGCHVLVEKPMALSLNDADEMIRTCDRAGVKLFVVKQNRFNPAIQKARQAFESGRFGKIYMITVRVRWARDQAYYDSASWRGTWALDGGVLANQAAHHIDMLQWFGGDILTTYALAGTYGVKIEAEDTAVSVLKFKNGAIGSIEATTAVRPKNLEGSLSILGERGTVVVGGVAMNRIDEWSFIDSTSEEIAQMKNVQENVDSVYGKGHIPYYANVLDSLTRKTSALVDGLEGKKSLELINAIYESVETGSEVSLHFSPKKCKLGLS